MIQTEDSLSTNINFIKFKVEVDSKHTTARNAELCLTYDQRVEEEEEEEEGFEQTDATRVESSYLKIKLEPKVLHACDGKYLCLAPHSSVACNPTSKSHGLLSSSISKKFKTILHIRKN